MAARSLVIRLGALAMFATLLACRPEPGDSIPPQAQVEPASAPQISAP